MSLPTEILENILSFLQSDTTTLKACSRSHPILSQLTERYLYANITVQQDDADHHDVDDLGCILRKRPHIAKYVRALEIQFHWGPEEFLEHVSVHFPTLSMLRKVALTYTGYCNRYTWQIPEKFRLAFVECLRLPSLTDVCIDGFPFPLSILSPCQHIRNLSLRGWWSDDLEFVDNMCLPTIDFLSLRKCRSESFAIITHWIQSSHLTSLEFNCDGLDYPFQYLQHILACCHSLTSLDVDIGRRWNAFHNFGKPRQACYRISLSPISLSNLQQLTLRAEVDYVKHDKRSKFWGLSSPIIAIKQILRSTHSLKHLTLAFYTCIDITFDQADQQPFADVFCTPLHSLLAKSASSIDLIKLQVNSVEVPDPLSASPGNILSLLTDHSNPIRYPVERGTLIVTAGAAVDLLFPAALASASASSSGRSQSMLRKWSKKLFGATT